MRNNFTHNFAISEIMGETAKLILTAFVSPDIISMMNLQEV